MKIPLPGDRSIVVSIESRLRFCSRSHRLVKRGTARVCPQCDLAGEPGLQAPELAA